MVKVVVVNAKHMNMRLFGTPVAQGFKLRAPTSSLPVNQQLLNHLQRPRILSAIDHHWRIYQLPTSIYQRTNHHNAQTCRIHVRLQHRVFTTALPQKRVLPLQLTHSSPARALLQRPPSQRRIRLLQEMHRPPTAHNRHRRVQQRH
jgi:hypothetical protein